MTFCFKKTLPTLSRLSHRPIRLLYLLFVFNMTMPEMIFQNTNPKFSCKAQHEVQLYKELRGNYDHRAKEIGYLYGFRSHQIINHSDL